MTEAHLLSCFPTPTKTFMLSMYSSPLCFCLHFHKSWTSTYSKTPFLRWDRLRPNAYSLVIQDLRCVQEGHSLLLTDERNLLAYVFFINFSLCVPGQWVGPIRSLLFFPLSQVQWGWPRLHSKARKAFAGPLTGSCLLAFSSALVPFPYPPGERTELCSYPHTLSWPHTQSRPFRKREPQSLTPQWCKLAMQGEIYPPVLLFALVFMSTKMVQCPALCTCFLGGRGMD